MQPSTTHGGEFYVDLVVVCVCVDLCGAVRVPHGAAQLEREAGDEVEPMVEARLHARTHTQDERHKHLPPERMTTPNRQTAAADNARQRRTARPL